MDPQISLTKEEYWWNERELWPDSCFVNTNELYNHIKTTNYIIPIIFFYHVEVPHGNFPWLCNQPIQGKVLSERSGFSKHLLIPAMIRSNYERIETVAVHYGLGFLTYISPACCLMIHQQKHIKKRDFEGIAPSVGEAGSCRSWFTISRHRKGNEEVLPKSFQTKTWTILASTFKNESSTTTHHNYWRAQT